MEALWKVLEGAGPRRSGPEVLMGVGSHGFLGPRPPWVRPGEVRAWKMSAPLRRGHAGLWSGQEVELRPCPSLWA